VTGNEWITYVYMYTGCVCVFWGGLRVLISKNKDSFLTQQPTIPFSDAVCTLPQFFSVQIRDFKMQVTWWICACLSEWETVSILTRMILVICTRNFSFHPQRFRGIIKKLWGFSPPANYTDRATAACWRS
jgi:hypothetical protein